MGPFNEITHGCSFWHGSGLHDCVSQNKPKNPGSHLQVKSVLSAFGIHSPLSQGSGKQTLSDASQKFPKDCNAE